MLLQPGMRMELTQAGEAMSRVDGIVSGASPLMRLPRMRHQGASACKAAATLEAVPAGIRNALDKLRAGVVPRLPELCPQTLQPRAPWSRPVRNRGHDVGGLREGGGTCPSPSTVAS